MLDRLTRRGEAIKPPSIKAHEQLGALRVGTLRDHGPMSNAIFFDADASPGVARDREHLTIFENLLSAVDLMPITSERVLTRG